MADFDAILVPGGGLVDASTLPPWFEARLQHAIRVHDNNYIITLSAGTPHKAPPIDDQGFPAFESVVAARYLAKHGIDPAHILTECCSYDTIGNAFFSRVIHVEPRQLRRLLIITSEFHMTRVKAIFELVYGLPYQSIEVTLAFQSVPDVGLEASVLEARKHRERESLQTFRRTTDQLHSLEDMHRWLFGQHKAYSASGIMGPRASPPIEALDSY